MGLGAGQCIIRILALAGKNCMLLYWCVYAHLLAVLGIERNGGVGFVAQMGHVLNGMA
jgi:hypothetical protein